MNLKAEPPAVLIRIPVEGPIEFEFENCLTIEDRRRVLIWAPSVPGLADLIRRAMKIHQAERETQ